MREIKFRVWNINSKSWVLDFNNKVEHFDLCSWGKYYSDCLKWENLNSFKIQQYTGLKDKNSVEIYEGDIVKYDRCNYLIKNGKYTTGDENFNGDYLFIESAGCMDYGISLYNLIEKVKIIGNILENVKLLK